MDSSKLPHLHFSVKLLKYLTEMAKVNPIAKVLLQRTKSKFKDDHPDFFDISKEDKRKLSYLNDDRKKNLKVSEYYSPNLRYHSAPGKLLKKILSNETKESIEDWNKLVEEFGNMFQSLACYEGKRFEIWNGEKVRMAYLGQNYAPGHSTLSGSCMKGVSCQSYLDMFCFNDKKIEILVLLSAEGKVAGRALLWKPDKFFEVQHDDKSDIIQELSCPRIMDRVYCAQECDFELFYMYAKQNRWWRKQQQNYRTPTKIMDYNGNRGNYYFEVNLPKYDYDKHPYMDSVIFMEKKVNGTGVLHNNKEMPFHWAFRSTSGGKQTVNSWSESFHDD
jgi:hypothetical protein